MRAALRICFRTLALAAAAVLAAAGPAAAQMEDLPRVRSSRTRTANGGWKYDAYPQLESLDAGKTITVADLRGPGRINLFHITQLRPPRGAEKNLARAVVLEIFFDGASPAAVSVPLGDFFADGGGEAAAFTTPFVEKSAGSYNCYIPMPFRTSAQVTLRNETAHNLAIYTFVDWETLPRWEPDTGYFHAAWRRQAFPLTPDTVTPLFRLRGPGHLVGQAWHLATDEPLLAGFRFVMEGNVEHRFDGEAEPSVNYLGSEDSLNFSWGWNQVFNGYKSGINALNNEAGRTRLSAYRFRDRDALRFAKDLDVRINWTHEFRRSRFLDELRKRNQGGGAWVDYAVTAYWYGRNPAGAGLPLAPAAERLKPLLHPNPAPQ